MRPSIFVDPDEVKKFSPTIPDEVIEQMRKVLTEAKIRKTLDADFQTILVGIGFFCPPREEVTINDMERWYHRAVFEGRETEVYG